MVTFILLLDILEFKVEWLIIPHFPRWSQLLQQRKKLVMCSSIIIHLLITNQARPCSFGFGYLCCQSGWSWCRCAPVSCHPLVWQRRFPWRTRRPCREAPFLFVLCFLSWIRPCREHPRRRAGSRCRIPAWRMQPLSRSNVPADQSMQSCSRMAGQDGGQTECNNGGSRAVSWLAFGGIWQPRAV